jgi:peroxisomal membrane protein 2
LAEFLASYFAGEKDANGSYLSSRIYKMGLYGFFVSAPLSHYLVGALQAAFKGKKGIQWKLAQILTSLLTVTPITSTVFLVFMSIFAGARDVKSVIASLKVSLLPVLRSSWVASPIVLAIAQAFIPEHAWVPFFSLFSFLLGTYNNYIVKKKRRLLREGKKDDKLQ